MHKTDALNRRQSEVPRLFRTRELEPISKLCEQMPYRCRHRSVMHVWRKAFGGSLCACFQDNMAGWSWTAAGHRVGSALAKSTGKTTRSAVSGQPCGLEPAQRISLWRGARAEAVQRDGAIHCAADHRAILRHTASPTSPSSSVCRICGRSPARHSGTSWRTR